jgi:hypothetical protein
MEHLHPDDALEQLDNIRASMRPAGCYICVTPNRLDGPHDVSQFFDQEATGFHLKEYTVTELQALMKQVGFSKVKFYFGLKKNYWILPVFPIVAIEAILNLLPYSLRKKVVGNRVIARLIYNTLIAYK